MAKEYKYPGHVFKSFRISVEDLDKLKSLADEMGLNDSEIMRQLIQKAHVRPALEVRIDD